MEQPWPAGLGVADQARAQAGIDAFVAFYTLADQVYSGPGARDWSLDVYRIATGPPADELINTMHEWAVDGRHQEGTTTVEAVRVDAVSGTELTVTGCVGGDLTYRNADGSVFLQLTGAYRLTARVVTRDAGIQLVAEIVDPQQAPAC